MEKGDVSVLVGAPAGISEEELEATLEDVPAKVEQTAEMFAGGDSR